MPCPDVHYTLSVINHKTGEQLKVEVVEETPAALLP
jgi:hypothetical protein